MFCCRIDPPYISLLLLKNRGRSVSHRLFIWQCQVRVTEKKEVRQRHLQSESPFFPALTSHDKSPATMKILVTMIHTMWPYFSIKALLIVVVTLNTAAATAQTPIQPPASSPGGLGSLCLPAALPHKPPSDPCSKVLH